ncbi:hypothetical protein Nmel_002993, partial [Mimus melanotis]
IQGQAGWGSDKPGLVEIVPPHGRGVGPGRTLPSLQPKSREGRSLLSPTPQRGRSRHRPRPAARPAFQDGVGAASIGELAVSA